MKSSTFQKLTLALIVCTSVYCFYHLNFMANDDLLAFTQIDYMGEIVTKEDKLKEALIVILKSFVSVSM